MKIHPYLLILSACSTLSFGQTLTNQKSFGGSAIDDLKIFNINDTDGYYLFGSSNSGVSGNKTAGAFGLDDYWLIKTDNDFNIIWDKSYGGSASDVGSDALISEQGIFLFGNSYSDDNGNKTSVNYGESDLWVLNINESGNIIWQNSYGGSGTEGQPNCVNFSDTSILIVTLSNSPESGNKTVPSPGGYDIWLLEISKNSGNIIQQKVITHGASNGIGFVKRNPFNNHIYISTNAQTGIYGDKSEVGYGSLDAWLIELDESLNVVKEKVFGGSKIELAFNAIVFDENFIYVGCSSQSSPSGNKTASSYTTSTILDFHDAWLIKLNYDWSIVWDKSYGGNRDDFFSSLTSLPNGKFALISSYRSLPNTGNFSVENFGNNTIDMAMLLLDENGDILNQSNYGGTQDDGGHLFESVNGDYILVSSSNSSVSGNKTVNGFGSFDTWVSKIDLQNILSVVSIIENKPTIFPNPANDLINIASEVPFTNYQITDISGKTIVEKYIEPTTQLEIDLSKFNSGVYFLITNEKVIKFSKY